MTKQDYTHETMKSSIDQSKAKISKLLATYPGYNLKAKTVVPSPDQQLVSYIHNSNREGVRSVLMDFPDKISTTLVVWMFSHLLDKNCFSRLREHDQGIEKMLFVFLLDIASSSNGRTTDFDSVNVGSSPAEAAIDK